jgi:hypothetical protein
VLKTSFDHRFSSYSILVQNGIGWNSGEFRKKHSVSFQVMSYTYFPNQVITWVMLSTHNNRKRGVVHGTLRLPQHPPLHTPPLHSSPPACSLVYCFNRCVYAMGEVAWVTALDVSLNRCSILLYPCHFIIASFFKWFKTFLQNNKQYIYNSRIENHVIALI